MSFFWLENLNEKKRINQQEVEVLETTKRGTVLVCFKSETKEIYEIKAGKEIRSWSIEGEKRVINIIILATQIIQEQLFDHCCLREAKLKNIKEF